MNKLINVENILYKVDGNVLIDSLDLSINRGDFISIVGPSGAGKSTLVKVLFNKLNYNSGDVQYYLDEEEVEFSFFKKSLGIVFENSYNSFVCDKVYDELAFYLKKKGYSKDKINIMISKLCNYFKINDLLYCIPSTLSNGQKQLIALLSVLISEPDVLVIDDAFDMVDLNTKKKILSLLRKINQNRKTTIIYLTQDLDYVLYSKRIVIMSEGKVLLDKKTKEAIKETKLFKSVGLNLSFMMDLTDRLQYYDLIDGIELNVGKLVDKLWI